MTMLVDLLPEQVRIARSRPKMTWEEFEAEWVRNGPMRPRSRLCALMLDIQADGGHVVKTDISLACGYFSHRGLDELDYLLRDAEVYGLLTVTRFPRSFIRVKITEAGRAYLEQYLQTHKEPKLKVSPPVNPWVELARVIAPDGQRSYFNLETRTFVWGPGQDVPKLAGKGLRVRLDVHVLSHLFPAGRKFDGEQWLTGKRPEEWEKCGPVKFVDLPLHTETRLAEPDVLREPSKAQLRKAAL